MFSMVQVNRIYLIFNPVHFLVDSSELIKINLNMNPLGFDANLGKVLRKSVREVCGFQSPY